MENAPPPSNITYESYLKIRELLELQTTISVPPSHDEMHFIVVHQTFELWFKLMLHEAETIAVYLDQGKIHDAVHLFNRLNAILRLFQPMVSVIETMTPTDFLKFRGLLRPASGFQSGQFRELEFLCGVRDERYLKMFEDNPPAQARLKKRLGEKSIWDHFIGALAKRGLKVGDDTAQRAAVVAAYKDDSLADIRALCEAMISFDEMFSLWREHHVRMAERMIGLKPGTGQKTVEYSFGDKAGPMGTMGVEYLQRTLNKRFFPLLWGARTDM